ncbi:hypothetical protein DBL07_26040 [Achromobacter mucicolens]|nr:hypothetical protein DBL07_26040 [Achromobacter mucicolens]
MTLKLRIGVEDAVGADDFEVYVCNIKWLESRAQTPLLGAGYIIVDNYNFEKIELAIVDLISTC